MEVVDSIGSTKSKVYFILQLGYFKCSPVFHQFSFDDVRRDVRYILKKYFPKYTRPLVGNLWKKNILDLRSLLLQICDYHSSHQKKDTIESKIKKLMRIHSKHIDVFRELLTFLEVKRIMMPPYSLIQDIFMSASILEKNRLSSILDQNIKASIKQRLNDMLKSDNSLYEFTILKKQPKNFSVSELVKESDKCKKYRDLYEFSKEFLPKLGISKHSIQYYGHLAEYYTVPGLKSIQKKTAYLYLICYVYHRFQQISDNLITIFIFHVDNFVEKSEDYAKKKALDYKLEQDKNMPKISTILKMVADRNRPKGTLFDEFQNQAFDVLPEAQYEPMADYIVNKKFDEPKHKWQHVADTSMSMKLHMRPLILNIHFSSIKSNHSLIEAVQFLRDVIEKGKSLNQIHPSQFPSRFIPQSLKKHIREYKNIPVKLKNKKIRHKKVKGYHPDKYEFLIYRELRKQIDTGVIVCKDAISHKSLKDDLISDEIWKNKAKLLAELDWPNISISAEKKLAILNNKLHEKILSVNKNIANGTNKDIKINEDNTWTLSYQKMKNEVNNPFFDKLPPIDIANLMLMMDKKCNFLSVFTHIKPHFSKQKSDLNTLVGCILANAFSLSMKKMSERSDIKYSEFYSYNRNHVRIETIKMALDRVSNFTSKLDIFEKWKIQPNLLMGAVDGQKFETRLHTLQSRYSQKYFGYKKGVVAYNYVVNHVPVNTRMIGANEHESHFVFDIVYNNTSNIDPDAISGDQHSTNQLNFVVLDAINKSFYPNYRNIQSKVASICSLRHLSEYKDCFLKPNRKGNEKLITDEWDNVQRILASLVMQEATQSVIVKKLSAQARNDRTKRALWEYNNIFKSIHLLELIDDPVMRSNIRRTLNRVEGYHQLRRAIARVNGNRFKGTNPIEIEICNLCATLVANCIIMYNSLLIDSIVKKYEKLGLLDKVEIAKRISPVAWQNVNLAGKYELKKAKIDFNLDELIDKLIQGL